MGIGKWRSLQLHDCTQLSVCLVFFGDLDILQAFSLFVFALSLEVFVNTYVLEV